MVGCQAFVTADLLQAIGLACVMIAVAIQFGRPVVALIVPALDRFRRASALAELVSILAASAGLLFGQKPGTNGLLRTSLCRRSSMGSGRIWRRPVEFTKRFGLSVIGSPRMPRLRRDGSPS